MKIEQKINKINEITKKIKIKKKKIKLVKKSGTGTCFFLTEATTRKLLIIQSQEISQHLKN